MTNRKKTKKQLRQERQQKQHELTLQKRKAKQQASLHEKKTRTVFVLELDNTDYFVGFTSGKVGERLEAMFTDSKQVPAFVGQHDSRKIIKVIELDNVDYYYTKAYVTAYAVKMMAKVGYKHVRGGKFTLTDPDKHRETVVNQIRLGSIPYIEKLEPQIEAEEAFPVTLTYIDNSINDQDS